MSPSDAADSHTEAHFIINGQRWEFKAYNLNFHWKVLHRAAHTLPIS